MPKSNRPEGNTWQPYFSDTAAIQKKIERIANRDFKGSGQGRGRGGRNGKGNTSAAMRVLLRLGLKAYTPPEKPMATPK